MPEKPEVITVAKSLERSLIGRKIQKVEVYYENIIAYPKVEAFQKELAEETIEQIDTRGKWLVFTLSSKILLVHLRMEGKFLFRPIGSPRSKHEHVSFFLNNDMEWRYHDTRKFGRMILYPKEELLDKKPFNELGYEYNDPNLTKEYLFTAFQKRHVPIKTVLLDQSIIAGIGNIYADEILFLSRIHPSTLASSLSKQKCQRIVENTKDVLMRAIQLGGTTIHSFSSQEGVHGKFQNELLVHGQKKCPYCQTDIKKIYIGGRGTYYCPRCQRVQRKKVKA